MTYTIDGAIRFLHDQIKETDWKLATLGFDCDRKSPSLTLFDRKGATVHTNDEGLPNKYEHAIKGKPFDYEAAFRKIWAVKFSVRSALPVDSCQIVVDSDDASVTLHNVQSMERVKITRAHFKQLIEERYLVEFANT